MSEEAERENQSSLFDEKGDGFPHDVVDPFVRALPEGGGGRARDPATGEGGEHNGSDKPGGAVPRLPRLGDRKPCSRWSGRSAEEQLGTFHNELGWALQLERRPAVRRGLVIAWWLLNRPGWEERKWDGS